jgi:hypothetical protein
LVSVVGERAYKFTPNHDDPASWQLEQLLVTPAWIIAPVVTGVWNAVPGTVFVAAAGTSVVGVLPK